MELKLNPNLPKNNLVTRYMEYGDTQTDAYPEWHFASAVSLLSVIIDRKIVLPLTLGDIHPNIWFFGIGDSTVSRKTTGMGKAETFLAMLEIDDRRLPNSFSPEAFIEVLSETPKSYYWKDEAGGMLASMEKAYMADMRDLFCELYENKDYRRKLRTSQRKGSKTDFHVHKPYLTQYLLTTPDIFKCHTSLIDLTSGWLLRYLYLWPEYPKKWMGFREKRTDDIDLWAGLFAMLREKKEYVNALSDELKIGLTSEAWDFFETWQRVKENTAVENKDRIVLAILGRLEIYALKLAIVFEFGEPGTPKTQIQKWSVKAACDMIDSYFLPIAKKIVSEIEVDETKNLLEKILGTLRRAGGAMTQRELLRALHRNLKDVGDALESLTMSGEIEIKTSEKKTLIRLLDDHKHDIDTSVPSGSTVTDGTQVTDKQRTNVTDVTDVTDDTYDTHVPAEKNNVSICGICNNPLNGETEQGPAGMGKIHTLCALSPIKLKFLTETRLIIGNDVRQYGPYKPSDIDSLPFNTAYGLIQSGIAVRVDKGLV